MRYALLWLLGIPIPVLPLLGCSACYEGVAGRPIIPTSRYPRLDRPTQKVG